MQKKDTDWNARRPKDDEEARSLIIDAAYRCIERLGYEKTKMADVAREAGISRTTLYRRYSNLFDLVYEATSRESMEFANKLLEHLKSYEKPEDQIIEAIVFTVSELPKTQYISMIFGSSLESAFSSQLFDNDIFEASLDRATESIYALMPELKDHPVNLAEVMIRFSVSLLQFPGKHGKSKASMREFLRLTLIPIYFPDTNR